MTRFVVRDIQAVFTHAQVNGNREPVVGIKQGALDQEMWLTEPQAIALANNILARMSPTKISTAK